MNQRPVMQELEGIFGITIEDLRLRKNTEELKSCTPPMMVFKVNQDFKISIDSQEFTFLEDDIYVMQFNLYYSILGYLQKDNKESALTPYEEQFKDIYKAYDGQDLTGKKLFVMATSIGDTIFMLPVVKYLKSKYPSCKIQYAASAVVRDMIHCYPKGLVDDIVDSNLFIKYETIIESDYQLYPNFTITRNLSSHKDNAYDVVKEYAGLHFDYDEYKPELIPKKSILDELRGKLPDKFIVIQMRASTANRMLRPEKWRTIIPDIIKLGYDIVLIDNPGVYQLYENEITNYFPGEEKDHIWNLCKFTKTIKHSIAVISQAEMVVGIDSALVHIGAALNKPVVGVYGPFSSGVRLAYYSPCIAVEPKDVKCEMYPCFYHQDELSMGFCDYIRFSAFPDCMEKIDENDILKAIKNMKEIIEENK